MVLNQSVNSHGGQKIILIQERDMVGVQVGKEYLRRMVTEKRSFTHIYEDFVICENTGMSPVPGCHRTDLSAGSEDLYFHIAQKAKASFFCWKPSLFCNIFNFRSGENTYCIGTSIRSTDDGEAALISTLSVSQIPSPSLLFNVSPPASTLPSSTNMYTPFPGLFSV